MENNTMVKNNLKYAGITLMLIICTIVQVFAQIPVRTGPAPEAEIKKARASLDSDMNSLPAHKKYIYAMGIANPLTVTQYRKWMKQYPDNVVIPLSIGTVFYNAELSQAKEFLLRVVKMEPKNAKVWTMLSGDAFNRGEIDQATKYEREAMLADTSNAEYAASYLGSFEYADPNYKQKVFDFVKRFPTSELGAARLYWLGEQTTNLNDKINYFEELRKIYPPQKFRWSASGMAGLADAYLQTNPEKALTLINQMGDGKDWVTRKQIAESLMLINKLEQDQDYKDAVIELDRIKLPKYNHINDFIIFKKASLHEKAGDIKAAYDSLASKFAKLPTDELYNALISYGAKLGNNRQQVAKDIEAIRSGTAVAAYPFTLGRYTDNDSLNLASLKGKVVLLTFWFPACSPCRAEFPHFEAVLSKFKGEKLAYVGIDVSPLQDPYVIPLMKKMNYSFIPLRANAEFAAGHYGVGGEPENFLIDKNGKIIFKGFRIDESNRRSLELMIASLLQKD